MDIYCQEGISDGWLTIRVTITKTGTVTIFLDGELMNTIECGAKWTGGYVGVMAYRPTKVEFKNLCVAEGITTEEYETKSFVGVQLQSDLPDGYKLTNGQVSDMKVQNGSLEITSTGFSILQLPTGTGENQIPTDMTNYTIETNITPITIIGNYCGIIYGLSQNADYTGRAQFKIKNNGMEFWMTGCSGGVMSTSDTLSGMELGQGKQMALKLVVDEEKVEYYVNNVLITSSSNSCASNKLALLIIAVFKIKAHIHMNETTRNSQKGKHSERRVESHLE